MTQISETEQRYVALIYFRLARRREGQGLIERAPTGVDALDELLGGGFRRGSIHMYEVGEAGEEEPGVIGLKGIELEEDFVELQEARRRLVEPEPGMRRPTLGVISLDTLINIYVLSFPVQEEGLKATLTEIS